MKSAQSHKFQLILKNTDALSGTPKILMKHADLLLKKGHQVSVIAEELHKNLKNSREISTFKTFRWPQTNLFQRKFFDWQSNRIAKANGGIVIGHGDSLHQDILFLHTCSHLGAEVAPGPHNEKNLSIPFHRMIFEKGSFKEIVCVTHMMKNDIEKRFNPQVPIHVIYPGHDKNIHNQIVSEEVKKIRTNLDVKEGEIVLGVIASGNLFNRGAFSLIEAMTMIPAHLKEKVKILVVGKESKPSKIYNLAKEVGMEGRVYWMNPREDVGNIISAVDIVVHAAHIEASGLTLLEGLALGKPVITTRTVGFSEILPEEQKNFVIEKQDPGLIAEKVRVFLENPHLLKKLGEQNKIIAGKLDWEEYDRNFDKLIENYLRQ